MTTEITAIETPRGKGIDPHSGTVLVMVRRGEQLLRENHKHSLLDPDQREMRANLDQSLVGLVEAAINARDWARAVLYGAALNLGE